VKTAALNSSPLDARNQRIGGNLALARSLANRYRGRGIEYDDLYSAACVGLCKAADGFDEDRGLMFSTYAVPVILGEIKRLFREGGTVKVGRTLKELSLKATRIRDEMVSAGENPRVSDIAAKLGVTQEEAAEAVLAGQHPLSLTRYDEDDERRDFDCDLPVEAPQSALTERIALKQSLSSLNGKDRQLILFRYFKNLTQAQTGKMLGMTQVQVSRREKKILQMLREKME
jgi:RNA polymerase sporulation-specific sigma factor